MKAQDLLAQIKKMTKTPKELPKWPFSEAIVTALVQDPAATAQFIEERLHKTFQDRDEIGEHRRQFIEVSGISAGNLAFLIDELGLKTLPTQKTLDREAYVARVKEEKHRMLEAACAVIGGRGSPQALEEETGIGYRSVYKMVRKLLKPYELVLDDLRHLSMPKRQALATRIYKDGYKKLFPE